MNAPPVRIAGKNEQIDKRLGKGGEGMCTRWWDVPIVQ